MNKIIKPSLLVSLLVAAANVLAVAPAQVPVTGQSLDPNVPGANKGVAWPSPRFVAGTGTTADCITDKLTGLMWPKNGSIGFEATDGGGPIAQPNYANTVVSLNRIKWSQALTAVSNMNTASVKLCGYSDWRLPNKVELKSMVNYGQASSAIWLNTQGFSNVNAIVYWSSSTYALDRSGAWGVDFSTGYVDAGTKTGTGHVWPVRGGQ